MLDIFRTNPAFTVTAMTEAMREVVYVPGMIGRLGLFTSTSISTLDVAIEKKSDKALVLVPSSPRGGPGQTQDKTRRSLRKLSLPHFQRDDAIMADEVQQVRAFGDEVAVEMLQGRIAERAVEHSNDFAVTEEYHRLKVITEGKLLDANGDTIFDYATEFGETMPTEIDWELDAASPAAGVLRKRCATMVRAMAGTLDGLPFTRIVGLCGDAFFDDLLAHPEVRATYLSTPEARALREAYIGNGADGAFGVYEFGDILFINYRGGIGGTPFVGTDKCHFFPMGTPGLFRTHYGPADYIETVNRPGQRLYAKQWEMPNGKGVNLEYQMNAIHYCTRPRVLMKARRT